MKEKMSISGPWISEKEIEYVNKAIESAWYEDQNSFTDRFEEEFREYTGAKYAVALPSGSAGIHLALLAHGIGKGHEVIVPEFARARNVAPILSVGATPIFADVDPQNWCLAVDSFKKWTSSKTKAVIAVDLYGNMPNWEEFNSMADRKKITVIEDAGEAIASEYKGQLAGTFGSVGVYSFDSSRTMTTGEGGMLITKDKTTYESIKEMIELNLSTNSLNPVFHTRMTDMQAALGLAQLERIAELTARKQDIFYWYENELEGMEGITLNYEAPGTKNTYWLTSIIIDPSLKLDREEVMQKLAEKGIETSAFYPPMSSLPEFEEFKQAKKARKENTVSYQLSPFGFNLPSALNLTEEDVHLICEHLKDIFYA